MAVFSPSLLHTQHIHIYLVNITHIIITFYHYCDYGNVNEGDSIRTNEWMLSVVCSPDVKSSMYGCVCASTCLRVCFRSVFEGNNLWFLIFLGCFYWGFSPKNFPTTKCNNNNTLVRSFSSTPASKLTNARGIMSVAVCLSVCVCNFPFSVFVIVINI